jgi:RNA recognition motif-containing protein
VSTKLFVGGLPLGCSQSELQSLFAKYGKVIECDIVRDYAFVVWIFQLSNYLEL